MTRQTFLLTLALLLLLPAGPVSRAATLETTAPAPVRVATRWSADSREGGAARARGARQRRLATVKVLFARAGVAFPPARVLLRAYKQEGLLEVWAASQRAAAMKKVATYEICSQGAGLGPKTRQGDGKTPEGFYRLDRYNQRSSFHLSMRVDYPNRLDRQLRRTGGAIMIHGACVSIGCLAMTDERIEELWVITRHAARGAPVDVHLFPGRDLRALIEGTTDERLRAFWSDLKAGHDAFAATHVVPRIAVREGRYVVR